MEPSLLMARACEKPPRRSADPLPVPRSRTVAVFADSLSSHSFASGKSAAYSAPDGWETCTPDRCIADTGGVGCAAPSPRRTERGETFAADQSIAGIDVHALRPGPGSPRPCRWRFFDLTSDPSRQSPLREGLAELGDRRDFLRIHFDPLGLGDGKSYELQLCGAGDGEPTGLILPVFGAPRPWGILSVQSDPQGPPVDRADQCLRVRILQVPQQE